MSAAAGAGGSVREPAGSASGARAAAAVRVSGPDHVVIRSRDPAASVEWWTRVLGLEPVRLAEYRAGKAPFPSVRVSPGFIIDFAGKELAALAGKADPGEATADGGGSGSGGAGGAGGLAAAPVASGQLDHVCLCLEDGADMDAAAARLAAAGAPPRPQFDGTVVQRFGARGGAKSVYIETPEGVTLELRSYPSAAGLAT